MVRYGTESLYYSELHTSYSKEYDALNQGSENFSAHGPNCLTSTTPRAGGDIVCLKQGSLTAKLARVLLLSDSVLCLMKVPCCSVNDLRRDSILFFRASPVREFLRMFRQVVSF